jgi:Flp pilus assembly protein TadD
LDEAIDEYREALGLDKDFLEAHINLGMALRDKNQLDEAIDECHEAIRLQKESALAHNNLGNALCDKGQLEDAIAEYRVAIHLKKDFALAHNNLGLALHRKGKLDEAIDEFREAIGLKKDFPEAHRHLGVALGAKGRLNEAIAEYSEAIRLKKDYWEAHVDLGIDLHTKGQLEEAIAEYREALQLKPKDPRVHNMLGAALRLKGALDRLPGILKGEAKPADAADCLALAELCQQPYQRLYAASARFYGEAFAADPSLTDGRSLGNRYNAACAAALASCGTGEDGATLTDSERARLRKQALDWLRGELAVWASVLEKGTGWPAKARASLPSQLQHWQQDPDLAGVRGPEALGRLPDADRHAWQKLWEEVEALRRKAAGME